MSGMALLTIVLVAIRAKCAYLVTQPEFKFPYRNRTSSTFVRFRPSGRGGYILAVNVTETLREFEVDVRLADFAQLLVVKLQIAFPGRGEGYAGCPESDTSA